MYQVFELPEDFLSREYTQPEKSFFDKKLTEAIYGPDAITEALTPEQEEQVSSWTRHIEPSVKSLHDSVFGQGNDRIIFPYDSSNEEAVTSSNYTSVPEINNVKQIHHHEVIRNLTKLGYRTSDYVAGFASHIDSPDKKVKISKILVNTGAGNQMTPFYSKPTYEVDENGAYLKDRRGEKIVKRPPTQMTLSQVYAADPIRAASTKEKQIVITRNPYDVAGMSTDRGWRSCMHMVDGCNRHYLPNDIKHGTLTAYVTTVGDDGIKSPIGRINLKRFVSNRDGSSIFRQETASYGTIPTNMKANLKEWATTNYPSRSGIYQKHSSLYNDDGNSILMEKPEDISGKEAFEVSTARAGSVLDAHERMVDNLGEPNEKDWDNDYDERRRDIIQDGENSAYNEVEKIHSKLSDKNFASAIIHSISDHSKRYSGNGQNYQDMLFANNDGYDDYRGYSFSGHDVAHAFAIDSIGGSYFTKVKRGISQMTPDETLEHLAKIHEGFEIKRTQRNDHSALKEVHAELIKNMIDNKTGQTKPEFQHVMDHELSHMLKDNNHEYYSSLEDERGINPLLDHAHPVMLTKNPRLMHTIINHGEFDSPVGEHDTMAHMGQHADAKLADHVLTNVEHFGEPSDVDSFMSGLNENANAKHIQHSIVGAQIPLKLSGGSYSGSGEIRPIHTNDELQSALSGFHREQPTVDVKEKDSKIDKFYSIAKYTNNRDVYNSIMDHAFGGKYDHPDIHQALRDNSNFREKRIDESVTCTITSFSQFRKNKNL